jgi:DNA-directed RNA polymerase specialized sigma24 family protein
VGGEARLNVEELMSRDAAAIANAYGMRLRIFVSSKVSDLFVVDEILADTIVTAWQRQNELPNEPAALWVWLRETAHNHCRNHVRSKLRRQRLELRLIHETHHATSWDHESEHPGVDRLGAKEIWDQLSYEERWVLRLADRPHVEASAALGLAIGAFRMRLHRLRLRLDELMNAASDSEGPTGGG